MPPVSSDAGARVADKAVPPVKETPETEAAGDDLPERDSAVEDVEGDLPDDAGKEQPAPESVPEDGAEASDGEPAGEPSDSAPSEYLTTGLWRAACARWVFVSVAAGVWVLHFFRPTPWVLGGWLGVFIIGLTFINALQMVCARIGMPISPSLVLSVDVAAATGLFYVTGGGRGAYCLAYFFPVITAILAFGAVQILFASLASAGIYALYCLGDTAAPDTPRWVGLAMCMVLLGLWGIVFRVVLARLGGRASEEAEGAEAAPT